MTLRTPRRRISPRTKRRYRAIKEFLRRALGTTSQPDTKTNSNISVSVSDLKHKIVGIEKQLDQVSQHCRNLITVDDGTRCESTTRTLQNNESKNNIQNIPIKINPVETKVLYKTSENLYKNCEESDFTSRISNLYNEQSLTHQTNKSAPKIDCHNVRNKKKIRKCENELHVVNEIVSNSKRRKKALTFDNNKPPFLTASYYSSIDLLKPDIPTRRHEKRRPKIEYNEEIIKKDSNKNKEVEERNNIELILRKNDERSKRKRYKSDKKELDKDFIADIIRRQYKPVKLFNKRESDLSQLSAPLCRDQDFSVYENIQEGSELCSCCFDEPINNELVGYRRRSDSSDVRSICDTRLYSSKRYPRLKQNRRNQEYYNDSLYDLVPVKEKSSPKSRRKFANDNIISYDHYKEVPPSPRSLRPRLNLKAQHYDELDNSSPYVTHSHQKMLLEKSKTQNINKNLKNHDLSDFVIPENNEVLIQTSPSLEPPNFLNQNDVEDESLQYPSFAQNPTNSLVNDLSFNKTQEIDICVDKTDKALCEIKDILQTFLEEMKKETTSDKSDAFDKTLNKSENQKQDIQKTNVPMFPNSNHSFHYTNEPFAGKPCVPAFPNACCYPLLPICPINCVQSGYVMPSQSYTCAACNTLPKEAVGQEKEVTINLDTAKVKNDETQQLIKEIYNFVKQSPKPKVNAELRDVSIENIDALEEKPETKLLTSRSVGAGSNMSVHDVKVGTSQMKCYSKSCEAFGSKKADDNLYSNGSYSDTILEKLSLEAAAAQESDFDFSSILDMKVKPRKQKTFSKVLRSFGSLLKKRKKDVIEELSESESTVEEDMNPISPFRQQVTNYMMRGEEYYQQPPFPPKHAYQPRPPECSYRQSVGLESRHGYQHLPPKHAFDPYAPMMHHGSQYQGTSPSYTTSFDNHYNQIPPQVPLCLKEIEVKSIGTQSEKKQSFF
ncbi:unnamed protein product [Parnassius apollo]|uniref:(apollo) hypothetical protein n=1 Tax=Parnassius apollo TaxID=110799 RepID=A0A8S3XC37_PARAO|nr:unnamed protein product [Parnassius apollo]